MCCYSNNTNDVKLTHYRIGHLSKSKMDHLSVCKGVSTDFICDVCSMAKFHRLPFPLSNIISDC